MQTLNLFSYKNFVFNKLILLELSTCWQLNNTPNHPVGITADEEELYGDEAEQTKPENTHVDLYVRFKMVHVVTELVWDTIEDKAEQTKPEDSDEELLRGPWFSEHLYFGDDTCGFQHHESSSSKLFKPLHCE